MIRRGGDEPGVRPAGVVGWTDKRKSSSRAQLTPIITLPCKCRNRGLVLKGEQGW